MHSKDNYFKRKREKERVRERVRERFKIKSHNLHPVVVQFIQNQLSRREEFVTTQMQWIESLTQSRRADLCDERNRIRLYPDYWTILMAEKEREDDFAQRAQNIFASFFYKDDQNIPYYLHTNGYLEALHDSLVKEVERRFQSTADKEMLFQRWKRCCCFPLLGNWNHTVVWDRKTPSLFSTSSSSIPSFSTPFSSTPSYSPDDSLSDVEEADENMTRVDNCLDYVEEEEEDDHKTDDWSFLLF